MDNIQIFHLRAITRVLCQDLKVHIPHRLDRRHCTSQKYISLYPKMISKTLLLLCLALTAAVRHRVVPSWTTSTVDYLLLCHMMMTKTANDQRSRRHQHPDFKLTPFFLYILSRLRMQVPSMDWPFQRIG